MEISFSDRCLENEPLNVWKMIVIVDKTYNIYIYVYKIVDNNHE